MRFGLGAAFLRAVRFTFLRSAVSVIAFVFAILLKKLSLPFVYCLAFANTLRRPEQLSERISNALQLRKLFHQFFYAEPMKLYRNLCMFPFSFSLKDNAFPIFRVAHSLSAAKAGFASRLWNGQFGPRDLLSSGAEKLRNVVDGTAALRARRPIFCRGLRGRAGRALVFVFVAPMRIVARLLCFPLAIGPRGLRHVATPGAGGNRRAEIFN